MKKLTKSSDKQVLKVENRTLLGKKIKKLRKQKLKKINLQNQFFISNIFLTFVETIKNMKKVFNEKGDLTVRFASDSKEQITEWLNGVEYDYAMKFAKEVDDPIFGKALAFPCIEEWKREPWEWIL